MPRTAHGGYGPSDQPEARRAAYDGKKGFCQQPCPLVGLDNHVCKTKRCYVWHPCEANCAKKHKHREKRCEGTEAEGKCTINHGPQGHCYEDCTKTIHVHNWGGSRCETLKPGKTNCPRSRNPKVKKSQKKKLEKAYDNLTKEKADSEKVLRDCGVTSLADFQYLSSLLPVLAAAGRPDADELKARLGL